MQKYIGVKQVEAKPMTRNDYNDYRGWTVPADENPYDEGYLVKHSDNYESWIAKYLAILEARAKLEDINL